METYYGHVRTPADAIKLFEACRVGMLPRVQRRLSEKERQAIRCGSVFVWDEREAGMRRWTDGKSWSASRVSGSFLTYREMEGKRGSGFGGGRRGGAGKTPDSGRGSDEDQEEAEPDGYRYKADGLMKQSFSITTSSGQHLHLISYFTRNQDQLQQPVNDPQLRHIVPAKGMYPESSLNEGTPALGRAPMQQQQQQQQPPYGQPSHPGPPHPSYPPQYQQYWPPSPVATPPYSHNQYNSGPPYQQQPALPQLHHQYQNHPHQHPQHSQHPQHPQHPQHSQHPQHPHQPHPYQHIPPQSAYDRAPLPPLQPSTQMPPKHGMPLPHPNYQPTHHTQPAHHSPHISQPPRMAPIINSPHSQQLQAQAREAIQIDPQLGPNQQGPLPSMAHQHQQNGAVPHSQTPPSRALSASPPRSSHSEPKGLPSNSNASTKASLSALLSPINSEPSNASPGGGGSSAGDSPRSAAAAAAPASNARTVTDVRAVGMLDKKFR